MRGRFLGVLFGVILAGAAALTAGAGERGGSDLAYVYAVRATNQTATAACSGEVAPDQVLIVGGMSVESLKPLEAKRQLEKQLTALESYATEQAGRLRLLERIRAVRDSGQDRSSSDPEVPPFLLLQQLEIEFPLGVDIDAILERVLQLGLDTYGRNPRLGYADTTPKAVVRYRVSHFGDELERLHRDCELAAWEEWCGRNAPLEEVSQCVAAGDSLRRLFVTNTLTVQSQPVLTEQSGVNPLYFNYPWSDGQLENVELLGERPLRLSGTITLTISGQR